MTSSRELPPGHIHIKISAHNNGFSYQIFYDDTSEKATAMKGSELTGALALALDGIILDTMRTVQGDHWPPFFGDSHDV